MDFFDRHKALIITSLLFAILMLALFNFNLSSNNKKVSEMLVELNQLKADPETQPEDPEEKSQNNARKIQTHQAFNEDKKTREADFKNKLDEIFEKNSAEQEAEENEETKSGEGNYSIKRKNAEDKKQRSDGDNSGDEASQKSAAYDYSSISFSLKGRRAVKIPNPVYTCDTAGKVVINITVDANGYVIDTFLNKGSSTTSNECLIDRAMEYANDARFSKLAGRNSQPGTITYHFKS